MTELLHIPGRRSALASALVLASAVAILAACNTVAGAGKDVGAAGNAITGGADKTKQALPPSPGPNQ